MGLLIALAGGYLGSTLPLAEILTVAGSWGGGKPEDKDRLWKEVRWKSFWSNILLVIGTALQIVGAIVGAMR